MGISSLPSPSEGMLCVVLVNTALSISMVKSLIRSIIGVFGIHLSSSAFTDSPSEAIQYRLSPPETYVEEFRSRTPAIRFESVCGFNQGERIDGEHEHEHEHDCLFCLTAFEPESEINLLSCGHLFHKVCLEKWLKYWNITCPLCRSPLITQDGTSCF